MMGSPNAVREIFRDFKRPSIRYSICTMVTRKAQYDEMVRQFRDFGFDTPDCEFFYIDNTESNDHESFAGYNKFLQDSSGTYIVLCHQDLVLLNDGRPRLDQLVAELDLLDPDWGLCGNAGAKSDGRLAMSISDPNTPDCRTGGPFPARVVSLDENFIVARRDANLSLSHDIKGYHLYGSDLCIIASILGYNAYVIDFHLRHDSAGNVDASFEHVRSRMIAKYRAALRPRWHHVTTHRSFYLSHSPARTILARVVNKLSQKTRSR